MDSTGTITTSRDLRPRRLHLAEALTFPLFWLPPLTGPFLGVAMLWDVRQLEQEYDLEVRGTPPAFYITPFLFGHLATLLHRYGRVREFAERASFADGTIDDAMRETLPRARALRILLAAQVVALVALVVSADAFVRTGAIAVFGANIAIGPVAAWFDVRQITDVETLEWGWTRYLSVLLCGLPFGNLVYFIQRQEHVGYALIAQRWDEATMLDE